ncbi:hypothetical protein BT93_L4656 [Corymbia citriodora subsp. variegata]|uniref:Class II aldolase/adducin N-terminal domain-containing protein n=1 Tax=Corymbia citriodora subsp. variegata TaxID=360336 RepID=A0A8T0CJM2_CORYI|nr:hypothetical protein BT93_L4656 [Corymbia citriodora subsp. variegata]
MASESVPESLLSTLVTANHILHYQSVVDAYGHISVRNPSNPATFFLSGSLAPALVSSLSDLVEYNVEDASAVREDAPRGYAERFIHSEIYKKYKDVNSVIHSHSETVVPYSISSVPLRPVLHMGGVMGAQVPIYDIALHYTAADSRHDLLVTNQHLGAALAAGFSPSTLISKTNNVIMSYLSSAPSQPTAFPTNPTVLMRGHGFTCVGTTIEEAVYRAVYTCTNAKIQTTSLLLQGGFNTAMLGEKMGREDAHKVRLEEIKYLSERECKDAWEANKANASRPWKLWCAEVKASGLYKNEVQGS